MDNDERKWSKDLQITVGDETLHFPIKSPKEILRVDFDEIILATMVGYEDNLKQLQDYKIPKHKIEHLHLWKKLIPRIQFLESFAKECKIKNLDGNVAELGVFQGEFAKKINEFFPNKTLFDDNGIECYAREFSEIVRVKITNAQGGSLSGEVI